MQREPQSRGERDVIQVHRLPLLHIGSLGIHEAGVHVGTCYLLAIFLDDVVILLDRHGQRHGLQITAKRSTFCIRRIYGVESSLLGITPTHAYLPRLIKTVGIVLRFATYAYPVSCRSTIAPSTIGRADNHLVPVHPIDGVGAICQWSVNGARNWKFTAKLHFLACGG